MQRKTPFERTAESARRQERRDGKQLVLIGAIFLMAGVFLIVVVKAPWMGAIGVCFGLMGVVVGIVKVRGRSSLATDILMAIGCFLFAVTSALMIVSGIVAPGAWGWRGGGAGIIGGAVGLAFFGPGTVLLVIKCVRRYRAMRAG